MTWLQASFNEGVYAATIAEMMLGGHGGKAVGFHRSFGNVDLHIRRRNDECRIHRALAPAYRTITAHHAVNERAYEAETDRTAMTGTGIVFLPFTHPFNPS